jgi:hypothetical protein
MRNLGSWLLVFSFPSLFTSLAGDAIWLAFIIGLSAFVSFRSLEVLKTKRGGGGWDTAGWRADTVSGRGLSAVSFLQDDGWMGGGGHGGN